MSVKNPLPPTELDAVDEETSHINVIIETPRGCRNKFKYDLKSGLYKMDKVLPAGAVFPYDFGFIPSTLGEDGDPLDIMVFMDQPLFPGNLVTARLVGAIEAKQTENGVTKRNDRLIGVASECQDYRNVKELTDLDTNLLTQIEHFFVSYNQMEGREFEPIGRPNARQAQRLLEQGKRRFEQKQKSK